MYIWRTKSRRDRRHLRLSGAALWGTPKGETSTEAEDDLLRHEGEICHVGYFHDRIRVVMHQYLNSTNGKIEVALLVTALHDAARKIAIAKAEQELEAARLEAVQKGLSASRAIVDHSKVCQANAKFYHAGKRPNLPE